MEKTTGESWKKGCKESQHVEQDERKEEKFVRQITLYACDNSLDEDKLKFLKMKDKFDISHNHELFAVSNFEMQSRQRMIQRFKGTLTSSELVQCERNL